MDNPLVSLRHVNKTFSNGTVALRDLNLDVGEKQFMSLLGPSGCGKSTALRLIAGLGSVSTGSIDWPGHPADEKKNKDISFVFQEPTLMPWATAWNNVYLPLKLDGISKSSAREAVDQALENVGLSGFGDSYPRELSGGMKMRVSIARALVTKPKVMLMDEPFAALDEITRNRLNDDLIELWERENWTVIFVTHSVFESVYLSNRIVVMAARPGRIIEDINLDLSERGLDGENYRTTKAYADQCKAVSASLNRAMEG